MSRVNYSGADTQEKNAVFGILSVELAHGNIHRAFADGVRSANVDVVLVYQISISHARAYGNNLFDIPLENQGQIEVKKMDDAYNVDLEAFQKVLFKLFGRLRSGVCELLDDNCPQDHRKGLDSVNCDLNLQFSNGQPARERRDVCCVGNDVIELAASDLGDHVYRFLRRSCQINLLIELLHWKSIPTWMLSKLSSSTSTMWRLGRLPSSSAIFFSADSLSRTVPMMVLLGSPDILRRNSHCPQLH